MRKELTVKKKELLDHLWKNREAHLEDYETALIVYHKDLREKLMELAEDAAKNLLRKDNYLIGFLPPVLNLKDYDRHIGFLEMAEENEITITIEEYDRYINDNWEWIANVKMQNSFYSSRALLNYI